MKTNCNFCETSSNDSAILPYIYKDKMLNICMDCFADSIFDYLSDDDNEVKVYGIQCDECSKPLFTEEFPVKCTCGNIIKRSKIPNKK